MTADMAKWCLLWLFVNVLCICVYCQLQEFANKCRDYEKELTKLKTAIRVSWQLKFKILLFLSFWDTEKLLGKLPPRGFWSCESASAWVWLICPHSSCIGANSHYLLNWAAIRHPFIRLTDWLALWWRRFLYTGLTWKHVNQFWSFKGNWHPFLTGSLYVPHTSALCGYQPVLELKAALY